MGPAYLDLLWQELKAAIMVRWRVDTPEVHAEVARAREALLTALEEPQEGAYDRLARRHAGDTS